MSIRVLLACVASLVLLSSCDDGSRLAKGEATGLPYELVLIVPQEIYSGELRDSLLSVLEGSTPLLPQHEPMFRLSVIHSPMKEYKLFRSRLLVDVDPAAASPSMGKAVNVVAVPQMEVKITAPDAHSLALFIGQHREQLTDLFVDHELDNEASRLRQQHSQMVTDSLQHQFGHTVFVPAGFRASKLATDFFWAGTNLNDKDLNYVFYSCPWDGQPLQEAAFVAMRDSVMRTNIPGSHPGQFMHTTHYNDRPLVLSRARIIDNVSLLEVRGLWDVQGAALGGAFVAQARIDTAARRVLVNEGFIYSPHSPKRLLLRQMEAALRTFR